MRFFIFLFIFSSFAFSSGFIKGKGKFYSHKDDSLSFVKKQLLNNAYKDVLKTALAQLGFDQEKFFVKFDERLNEEFNKIEKNLDAKRGDNPKDEKYFKTLRSKKLAYQLKFGRLNRIIKSFITKRMGRSSHDPNMRFIRIEAKVYDKEIAKMYYRYVGSSEFTGFKKLYVAIDYQNRFFDYSAIGLSNESSFTSVVNEHWIKWLSDNKPLGVNGVEVLSSSELAKTSKMSKEELEASYKDALLIKVNVNLQLNEKNEDLDIISFKLAMTGFAYDIAGSRSIKAFSIKEEVKKYEDFDPEKLSSALANYVYRLPMPKFLTLIKSVKSYKRLNKRFVIRIQNFKNTGQILKYQKKLESFGVKYFLKTDIKSLSKGQYVIEAIMDGSLDNLKDIHRRLQADGQKVSFLDTTDGISVKFK